MPMMDCRRLTLHAVKRNRVSFIVPSRCLHIARSAYTEQGEGPTRDGFAQAQDSDLNRVAGRMVAIARETSLWRVQYVTQERFNNSFAEGGVDGGKSSEERGGG